MFKKVPEKWMVVVAVLLGTFTIILNNSMLNPAIPELMAIFDTDAVSIGWVITIFMVSMGITMPLTGYLGDKLGKKKLYMAGLVLFLIGSTLASMAWSLTSLILFRAIQGIAGGVMMPLSMALIFEVFPREERGLATGVWGIAAMMAPTIGPTLGGTIIETSSWHYLFLFNIPFGLLGLVASAYYLKSTEKVKDIKFDKIGFLLVTLGVGAVLFALGRISRVEHLTNPVNIGLILFGLIGLYAFVKYENRRSQPLLELSVFKAPTFSIAVWVASVSSIGLFSSIFLIPLLIQNVYGLSAIVTGLVFLPSALFSGIFMTVGGRMLDKKGPRGVVTTGLVIFAATTLALGFLNIETSIWYIVAVMLVRGIGMGLCNMPATTTGLNSIPDRLVAQGSAMNNVLRQISSSLGIVFISVYYEVRKAQLLGMGVNGTEGSLQAINEGFIVVGVLLAISIPAGWLIGQKEKREEAGLNVH